MNTILFWFKNARAHTLPMSVMSWLIVFVFALKQNGNVLYGFLALIGIMLVHLGVNLTDDYFDFKQELERVLAANKDGVIKLQKGKCQYLIDKNATLNQTIFVSFLFFTIASIIGVFLAFNCGWQVAAIAALGAVFCISYPFLTYVGLGELAVGITFAPLLMFGTYFVMTKSFSIEVALISISTGLLTVGLLHTHALMDFDLDIRDDKKTLCTFLKTKENSLKALGVIMFLAYLNIAISVYLKAFPLLFLVSFLTIPIAIGLYHSLNEFIVSPQLVPERKWWMGHVENYDDILKNNTQSFMLRFYTSRNLMMYFSLIIVILVFAI